MRLIKSVKVQFTYVDKNDREVTFSVENGELNHIEWDVSYEKTLEDLAFMAQAMRRFIRDMKKEGKSK